MTPRIRRATDETDLAAIAAITNETRPEWASSVAEMTWSDRTYPGSVRFVAEVDGRPIGAATVGRIYVHPPEYDALWATVDVLPDARGRGVGGALLREVAAIARDRAKTALHVPATEARPDAVAFLERRGFRVHERQHIVRLDLVDPARRDHAATDAVEGVVLTTLAERPDLIAGVHAVATDAFRDIPGGDEPMAVGDLAEFRARDVDRPGIPAGAFVVALEPAGTVIGYASLLFLGAARRVGIHDMTAVRREWRGRGIAGAMKRAQIAWAVEQGVEALETGNDEDNLAMQAVNHRLGYVRGADELIMRGSADRAMMRP